MKPELPMKEYSKLLMVPIDEDRGISEFSFTQSSIATWKNIIDELIELDYDFAIYNKSTKRIMRNKCQRDSEFNGYHLRCVEMVDEFKSNGNNSVDIFMFQASWRRAFIYQTTVLNDLDQYWLFFDESDCFPTKL